MAVRRSSTFARPANTTTYAAGDLVADNATAGSVTALQWDAGVGYALHRVTILTTNVTIANGDFRLWLLRAAPTVANGDNGALGGEFGASVIATVDVALTGSLAGSPGAGWGQASIEPGTLEVGGVVYGLLEARGAYAPLSAQTFTVTLELF